LRSSHCFLAQTAPGGITDEDRHFQGRQCPK
jgi:hypothetical protein